jgi:hypothetical protein
VRHFGKWKDAMPHMNSVCISNNMKHLHCCCTAQRAANSSMREGMKRTCCTSPNECTTMHTVVGAVTSPGLGERQQPWRPRRPRLSGRRRRASCDLSERATASELWPRRTRGGGARGTPREGLPVEDDAPWSVRCHCCNKSTSQYAAVGGAVYPYWKH